MSPDLIAHLIDATLPALIPIGAAIVAAIMLTFFIAPGFRDFGMTAGTGILFGSLGAGAGLALGLTDLSAENLAIPGMIAAALAYGATFIKTETLTKITRNSRKAPPEDRFKTAVSGSEAMQPPPQSPATTVMIQQPRRSVFAALFTAPDPQAAKQPSQIDRTMKLMTAGDAGDQAAQGAAPATPPEVIVPQRLIVAVTLMMTGLIGGTVWGAEIKRLNAIAARDELAAHTAQIDAAKAQAAETAAALQSERAMAQQWFEEVTVKRALPATAQSGNDSPNE